MRANLLLHPDSLKQNPKDSEEMYMEKFSKFTNDIRDILASGLDDHFLISSTLFDTPLMGDKNIFELSNSLGNDEKVIMYSILTNEASIEDCTVLDYMDQCKYCKDEETCSTIAILNAELSATVDTEYIQFENYEIVYGYSSWQTFRRQILGNHPGAPTDFISSAKILFPNLFFHSHCENSVTGYLGCIPRRIVYYLSCMNDKLNSYKASCGTTQAKDILEGFSTKYGLDKLGSMEMRPKHKPRFTYSFIDKNGNTRSVCCEPHLKIIQYDTNHVPSLKEQCCKFNARIYFHFGFPDIQDGKILIGSIGPHA